MTMRSILATCSLMSLFISAAEAQNPFMVTGVDGPMTTLALDRTAYRALHDRANIVIENFPLTQHAHVSLELHPLHLLSDNATIISPAGAPPDQLLLTGAVTNHPDSYVYLALSPHTSNGYITLNDQTYIIADARLSQHETVIYNLTTLPQGAIPLVDAICGVNHAPLQNAVHTPTTTGDAPCGIAKIAVDTDWEFSSSLFDGDTEASAAYALALLGAVSEVYKRDLNITLEVSFLRVWEDNVDPYDSPFGLENFATLVDHWESTMTHVDRDLVHLLAGSVFTDGLGGFADLPGYCVEGAGYAFSGYLNGFFPYPLEDFNPQNWDPFVVAHEIGHNFGALHTFEQSPPIDDCLGGNCPKEGGTIMSYCHICPEGLAAVVLRFADQTVNNYILPYIKSVPCSLSCPADINADCALSILDFITLQDLFNAGDPAADINNDGDLSILDFLAFQELFTTGC